MQRQSFHFVAAVRLVAAAFLLACVGLSAAGSAAWAESPAAPTAPVAEPAAATQAEPATIPSAESGSEAGSKPTAATIARTTPLGATALSDKQAALLATWYEHLGPRDPSETFGALVARAALLQKGKPYYNPPTLTGPEELVVRLEDFQCVSLVESSMAVARCVWSGTPDGPCFARELEGVRYRGGIMAGFASKLHYFDEWFTDNAERGRLHDLARELGGIAKSRRADYVTTHPQNYPPLQDPQNVTQMLAVEARLRASPAWIVDRAHIKKTQMRFESGDVIALVGSNADSIVMHAALVYRDQHGTPHLLHASSSLHQVVVGKTDLADYVLRRPDRQGVMIARPLAP